MTDKPLTIGWDPASSAGDTDAVTFHKGTEFLAVLTGEPARWVLAAMQENERLREAVQATHAFIAKFISLRDLHESELYDLHEKVVAALGINQEIPNEYNDAGQEPEEP